MVLLAHNLPVDVGELVTCAWRRSRDHEHEDSIRRHRRRVLPNESGRVTAVELMTTSLGTFAATHAFAALTTPRLSTSWGLPPFLLPDAA